MTLKKNLAVVGNHQLYQKQGVDYRINEITKKDSYPLSLIDNPLDVLFLPK